MEDDEKYDDREDEQVELPFLFYNESGPYAIKPCVCGHFFGLTPFPDGVKSFIMVFEIVFCFLKNECGKVLKPEVRDHG
jgi:hypothetical protein